MLLNDSIEECPEWGFSYPQVYHINSLIEKVDKKGDLLLCPPNPPYPYQSLFLTCLYRMVSPLSPKWPVLADPLHIHDSCLDPPSLSLAPNLYTPPFPMPLDHLPAHWPEVAPFLPLRGPSWEEHLLAILPHHRIPPGPKWAKNFLFPLTFPSWILVGPLATKIASRLHWSPSCIEVHRLGMLGLGWAHAQQTHPPTLALADSLAGSHPCPGPSLAS